MTTGDEELHKLIVALRRGPTREEAVSGARFTPWPGVMDLMLASERRLAEEPVAEGVEVASDGLAEAAQAIVEHAAYRRIAADYMGEVSVAVMPVEDLERLRGALRARPYVEPVVEEDEKSV